ncbi:MAG: chemotaxis response regulator protein-glutamate methylesterase [Spirochaetota bacterium]
MIRLLIVDDSALMRRHLKNQFEAEGDFEICFARNGLEAVAENRDFKPDAVTLDINMPEMDGLTALSLIMAERPVPVVMVSSLTEKGALATFEALNLGAVDYVAKPDGTISLSIDTIRHELVSKVRTAAKAKLKLKGGSATSLSARLRADRESIASQRRPLIRRGGVSGLGFVVIGVSTGGPRTLEEILPSLPADFPWPIFIAQHMPAAFTKSFAERLDHICELRVSEVSQPRVVEPGNIYLGRGGTDMVLANRVGRLHVLPKPECPQMLYHPSVELLGRSVLESCDPARVIGVMLTGMGNDGAEAFAAIKNHGGRTIAESEETAVVFGMPKELIDADGASLVLPMNKIVAQLRTWARE